MRDSHEDNMKWQVQDTCTNRKLKIIKKASHHAPHLDVADLGAAVCRPDLCDDRQRLEITGQTQITTGSCYLQKSTVGSGMNCFCIYILITDSEEEPYFC